MTRRDLLCALIRLPVLAVSTLPAPATQIYPDQPVNPIPVEDQIEEVRTAMYVYAFRANNHEVRIKDLEYCASNCRTLDPAKGPV